MSAIREPTHIQGRAQGWGGCGVAPWGSQGVAPPPPEVSLPPRHHREGAVTSCVNRGGGCGVAPPWDLRGGRASPPGVLPPPEHPRGGQRPPLNLFRGGKVLNDQYINKICIENFLAPCGRRFCNFLQDFCPTLGKYRLAWLRAGENFSGEEATKITRAKT